MSAPVAQRVDVWLFYARIAKTRSLAQALIERGKVRVNRSRIDKPSHALKPGDVLTISLGPRVRIIEVVMPGERRGPATEAGRLYRELTPAPVSPTQAQTLGSPGDDRQSLAGAALPPVQGIRPAGAARPTKRERRQTERLKDRFGRD